MTAQDNIVDCQGCGACCLHMGYPPFIGMEGNDHEAEPAWRSMPADVKLELLKLIDTYQPPPTGQLDGPCVWFDTTTRRCKQHEHRPNVCRDFKVGGKDCRNWRQVYDIGRL